jgi:hypothetical protein
MLGEGRQLLLQLDVEERRVEDILLDGDYVLEEGLMGGG